MTRLLARPIFATAHGTPPLPTGRLGQKSEPFRGAGPRARCHADKMHTSELTPEIRAALSEERPYPAITLVVPTEPDTPFNEKNRIILRDLVTEAKRRLADDPDVGRDTKLELRNHV